MAQAPHPPGLPIPQRQSGAERERLLSDAGRRLEEVARKSGVMGRPAGAAPAVSHAGTASIPKTSPYQLLSQQISSQREVSSPPVGVGDVPRAPATNDDLVSLDELARRAVGSAPVGVSMSEIGAGQKVAETMLALQRTGELPVTVISAQNPYDRGASNARYGRAGYSGPEYFIGYRRVREQLDRETRVVEGGRNGTNALVMVNSAVTDRKGGVAVLGVRWIDADGSRRSVLGRVRLQGERVLYQKRDLAALCLHWGALLREGAKNAAFLEPRPEVYRGVVEFIETTDASGIKVRRGSPEVTIEEGIGRRPADLRTKLEPPADATPLEKNLFWINVRSGYRVNLTEVGEPSLGLSQALAEVPFCCLYEAALYGSENVWLRDRSPLASQQVGGDDVRRMEEARLGAMEVNPNLGRASITVRTRTAEGRLQVEVLTMLHAPRQQEVVSTLKLEYGPDEPDAPRRALESIAASLVNLMRAQQQEAREVAAPGTPRPLP